jgi:hypothetical protein
VDVTYDAAKMLAWIGSEDAIAALVRVAIQKRAAVLRRVVTVSALGDVRGISEDAVSALQGPVGPRRSMDPGRGAAGAPQV